ncbi:MAG: recombinase family protein [Ignavibacteriales bacterium]|nr:recombinase family protein [Ignavibacteriales bacterium]
MQTLKIAVGYVRCSTNAQADTSPDQQKKLILEWAEKHGYKLDEWFVDIGKSGTNFEKRPEFRKLLDRINSKPTFHVVIALDESRWGRAGANDSIYFKTHFKKVANVDVLMVRTIANTGNPTFDTMLGAFEGGLSQEESKKKSERTYDGCLSAVKSGHSAGGTAPYGYQRTAINRFTSAKRILGFICDENGNPILNEKSLPRSEQIRPKEEFVIWEPGDAVEVEVIKRIFDMRVRYGYGYVKIAKNLNSEGITCPRRGKWSNKNQKWSGGTICAIVRNPAYRGARAYDRLKKRGIGKYAQRFWVRDSSQWIIIENSHPSIVTPDIWYAANPLREHSDNGYLARKRFDSPYLLSGLLVCSHCGFKFHGKTQRTGRPGNRKRRRTYTDSGYSQKGGSVCTFMNIGAEAIERKLIEEVKRRLLGSDIPSKLESLIKAHLAKTTITPHQDATIIDQSIRALDTRINNLLDIAERGQGMEEAVTRINLLKSEKAALELKKLILPNVAPVQIGYKQSTTKIAEFFKEFERVFDNAPLSERKALISQLVDRIIVDRENKVAKCYLFKIPKREIKTFGDLYKGREHTLEVCPQRDSNSCSKLEKLVS